MTVIPKDATGRYHPRSVEEVQALVAASHQSRTHVRVQGATLSIPAAIHADGYSGDGGLPPDVVEMVLDGLADVELVEEHDDHAIVAVGGGCLVGRRYDDRTGETWKETLSYQLQQRGYALPQTPGVSHQRIAGLLGTGTAGGSTQHSLYDTLLRIQFVDGTGALHDVRRDDPATRDMFCAVGVSMGLLGVVTRVWLRAPRTYNVVGAEVTTRFHAAAAELDGPGSAGRPGLVEYLKDTPYARILWWPQHDFDKVQVWSAKREPPTPGFVRQPFEVLPPLDALLGSLFCTVLGNVDDLSAVPAKLTGWDQELERFIAGKGAPVPCPLSGEAPAPSDVAAPPPITRAEVLQKLEERLRAALLKHPDFNEGDEERDPDFVALSRARAAVEGAADRAFGAGAKDEWAHRVAAVLVWALDRVFDGESGELLGRILKKLLPGFIDELLAILVKDGERPFADTWMCGLPMDNGMEEALWRTDLTELWIPLDKAVPAVRKLRAFFAANGDAVEAYRRTGFFTTELYAGAASDFWMSPGYGSPCLRVNVFWFHRSAGSPCDSFYPAIWKELQEFGFRPHWGKHMPAPSPEWRAHYRAHLPRFDDFLAMRAKLDPGQIFVSQYWRDQLGIAPEAAPRPRPGTDSLPVRFQRFYERVSREGAAALAELPALYTDDVHFQNPVVDQHGLVAFEREWKRAFSQYKVFQFEDYELVGDDHAFTMTYTMNIRFAIGPIFRTRLVTESRGRDGKVYETRDYFDVLGTVTEPFPLVAWAYKKIFGLLIA